LDKAKVGGMVTTYSPASFLHHLQSGEHHALRQTQRTLRHKPDDPGQICHYIESDCTPTIYSPGMNRQILATARKPLQSK
jgi:hypothetical protein